MKPINGPIRRIKWKEIAIFYLIAVCVSAPFRLGLVKMETLISLPNGLNAFYSVLKALGPILGFLVMFYVIRVKTFRNNSFYGTSKIVSILAILVIPTMMTILGVQNKSNLNIHYYGFIYSTAYCFYALFEEYGWRGYLQEAVQQLKLIEKIGIISVLWFTWHFNFLLPEMTLKQHALHFLFIILGTFGLIKITNKTKSILFATAVHLSFNLLTDVNGEFNKRLIVLSTAIVVWIILLNVNDKILKKNIYG